ncbi:MAG: DUF4388 domain-containing protein [Deltaproteobacteria bacterium]|nr:DUF4388 domain-containing protein [Deltaproteobacteria bacterium]
MSLRGTLGDFGIADIFQLIGHQAKTGVLLLKDRELEVRIFFVEGNVVKAEQTLRDKADLLGNIMVRSGVLTQAQLDDALDTQQRTLRRLGDILVDIGAVTRQVLKDFARLQTTETIYKLFTWRAGTYEFTAQPVDYDEASYEPIRSENILMEGFRMVDEWPAVRKIVASSSCTFLILRALPDAPGAGGDDDDDILAGMKDAFAAVESGEEEAGPLSVKPVGPTERQVFEFVQPGRTVLEIVDLARLGEFETTKALATLVNNRVLEVVQPASTAPRQRSITPKKIAAEAVPFVVRLLVFVGVAAVVGLLVRVGSSVDGGLLAKESPRARKAAIVDGLGEAGLGKLRAALGVLRVQDGRYPESLDALVTAGLVDEDALRFPYQTAYGYRRVDDGFELVLPLF